MQDEKECGQQVRSNDLSGVLVQRLRAIFADGELRTSEDLIAVGKAADEIERLSKDAERYRWLLRNAGYGITKHQRGELYLGDRIISAPDHVGGLSAAIDAAMLLTPNA